jgi:hypothetical protein
VHERRILSPNKPDIPVDPKIVVAGIFHTFVEIDERLEQTQSPLDFRK